MDYEELLKIGPYSLDAEDKRKIYGKMLSELTDRHRQRCLPYDRICGLLNDRRGTERNVEEIPMTPVSLFKKKDVKSIREEEVFKVLTSSGTTGQQPSEIYLDRETADFQQKTLERIVSSFIGDRRIPMLIIDSPDVLKDRKLFSARGAGILGFSIFGTRRRYALKADMTIDEEAVREILQYAGGGPVLVFGFTYMIWKYFYGPLKEMGKTFPIEQGFLIHGGGWKKLQDQAVSPDKFKQGLHEVCGITREKIINYYGMAEQTGCIYMECPCGHLHASSYSEILVRNMEDFSCCKNGTEGVIQVLTPMAGSYPGHSVLTEDKGIILGEDDCPCGRKGKYFRITGRIPKAEVRGCSDTWEEGVTKETSGLTVFCGSIHMDDTPVEPFSEETMDFLAGLSGKIRDLDRREAGEELRSLGFWLRRSHLEQMKKRYGRPGSLGLGNTFHIAPANIPLMFVYSCAIGLLAGNSCRVRISGRRTKEVSVVCRLIDELLKEQPWKEYGGRGTGRISVVAYDRERTDLTEQFSRECDARIIWGGDKTVEEVRKIPLKPSASELIFPDRISVAVFGAEAVLVLTDGELASLAGRFYQDTYGMDQNACSCPKIVYWREADRNTGMQAAERFWNAVAECSGRYELSEKKVSVKYGDLWERLWDEECETVRIWGNRLYVTTLSSSPARLAEERLRFGSFLEYHMKEPEEWTAGVWEKTQTLMYFGVNEADLWETVMRLHLKGVLRVVPAGQALWMEPVWDGKDLISLLSRNAGLNRPD